MFSCPTLFEVSNIDVVFSLLNMTLLILCMVHDEMQQAHCECLKVVAICSFVSVLSLISVLILSAGLFLSLTASIYLFWATGRVVVKTSVFSRIHCSSINGIETILRPLDFAMRGTSSYGQLQFAYVEVEQYSSSKKNVSMNLDGRPTNC